MPSNIKDRFNWLEKFREDPRISNITLDIGCGSKKFSPHAIGIDIIFSPDVDIVGDVFDVLAQIPDSTVHNIYSSHFFEHIEDVSRLLRECFRILKKNGKINIVVPHHSNPFFYSDPTHKASYGLYTFAYYAECNFFKRKVPKYLQIIGLNVCSIDLIFKSYRPRYLRHIAKKFFEKIVNFNSYSKELYEEIFVYIFPCYELHICLNVNK
jgi:predicted SAM-dependent methyltransferase